MAVRGLVAAASRPHRAVTAAMAALLLTDHAVRVRATRPGSVWSSREGASRELYRAQQVTRSSWTAMTRTIPGTRGWTNASPTGQPARSVPANMKASRDPDCAVKKARVEHLYAIADGEVIPEEGEPEVVFCMDEFGLLNLQPHSGRQWAERGGKGRDPDREPRPRRRATYTRPHGVRHLFAAYDLVAHSD
ncbi:hypothetical protein SVIO_001860 [Streptomyces violaceusniger]|uniref:Tc1-like transposase DDE domain-containing protein n=1 Tax=Streptomyces violaceusniger TaxID=68280 RepID=A0A4D4KUP6_STRVO|nr:hypothetical protein SVIO_001860 [Streptomyces violaceusniger]